MKLVNGFSEFRLISLGIIAFAVACEKSIPPAPLARRFLIDLKASLLRRFSSSRSG